MEQAIQQLKADCRDTFSHTVDAVNHALFVLLDLAILAGAGVQYTRAALTPVLFPPDRQQTVRKIVHDPERRAREAGL